MNNMDLFQSHNLFANHSVACKPPDSMNNRSRMTVISLLSKDFSERRKPA